MSKSLHVDPPPPGSYAPSPEVPTGQVVVGQPVMYGNQPSPIYQQTYQPQPYQPQYQPQFQPQPYQPQYYTASAVPQQTYAPQQQAYPSVQLGTEFTTGVCSCCDDMESLVEVFFCQPCQQSRQYNMLKRSSPTIEPVTCIGSTVIDWLIRVGLIAAINSTNGGAVGIIPIALLFFPWTQGLLAWHLRRKLEVKYRLRAESSEDAMVSVFAVPCAACQHYREMSVRGDWPRGCCITTPFVARTAPRMI